MKKNKETISVIRFADGKFVLFQGDYSEIEELSDVLELFDEAYYKELESNPENVLATLNELLETTHRNHINLMLGGNNCHGMPCFILDEEAISKDECLRLITERKEKQ